MAKRKPSSKRPKPQHNAKQRKSQHDKRNRLLRRNLKRRKTTAPKVPLTGMMLTLVNALSAVLDKRNGFRLGIIVAGMFLADDRRTASAWFAAGGVRDDWDRFYTCLAAIGRKAKPMAAVLLRRIVEKFGPGIQSRILLALDDSPTGRYGRHVEGAGVHHHPTPGPADGEWLYGHNWVTLAWLATHPVCGVIALPLLSMLYVRKMDVLKLAEKHGWQFHTKHQLGVEMMTWFINTIRSVGVQARVWLAVDGAYAARPFLSPLLELKVTVVSRLRSDARLNDLPSAPKPGARGRPRVYGPNKISLAKRAGQPSGWSWLTYNCRGSEVTRQYKTFLATSRLTGGVIRVVIVRFEDGGWAAYFCTDPNSDAQDILESVAARWAIEEHFHDVKEVWGAGQQQVRKIWSSIACWNLNQWLYTMVELCSWDRPAEELNDRSDRPWDNPDRRPSHADRRRKISREMLHEQFIAALPDGPDKHKLRRLVTDLIALAI